MEEDLTLSMVTIKGQIQKCTLTHPKNGLLNMKSGQSSRASLLVQDSTMFKSHLISLINHLAQ
jgi:hypothetical protein